MKKSTVAHYVNMQVIALKQRKACAIRTPQQQAVSNSENNDEQKYRRQRAEVVSSTGEI